MWCWIQSGYWWNVCVWDQDECINERCGLSIWDDPCLLCRPEVQSILIEACRSIYWYEYIIQRDVNEGRVWVEAWNLATVVTLRSHPYYYPLSILLHQLSTFHTARLWMKSDGWIGWIGRIVKVYVFVDRIDERGVNGRGREAREGPGGTQHW